jgi:D-alanyl-lipoteichoic acid acyltransferase DltB (MBOAT superfamily)
MLFNSIDFAIFLPIVFLIYWGLAKNSKVQNLFLLIASYFFYGWADWQILLLLIAQTFVFYVLGIAIFNAESQKRKSIFATLGVIFGIAVLGYFKYTNFFISSFKDLFESIGLQTNLHTLKIFVPIGISFYTFRLLSYVIDINRGKYEPTRDIVAFSTYVAFFPCILSGPIDRPNFLISQLEKKRVFDYGLSVDGMRQILWGLFKRIVIAVNCDLVTTPIFQNSSAYSGSTLILGAALYSIQIYADFSGYTDMAIGVGKLFGFHLTKNFNYPLFAQNIADYWRRWHISLTSWLTDYVFMPLNVKWRDWGKWGTILAIIVDFVICGFWHGANWTFLLWGLYHGLLFVPLILSGVLFKKTKIETYKWGFPQLKTLGNMLVTFFLVAGGMILFRAHSIGQAIDYISGIFSLSLFTVPKLPSEFFGSFPQKLYLLFKLLPIFIFLFMEWLNREKQHGLQIDTTKSPVVRWVIYLAIIGVGFICGGRAETFIYFQF